MIKTKNKIVGTIKTKNVLQGVISPAELRIYPELENLEITPSEVEQIFKSEKYGYNEVKVKATEIKLQEKTIIPNKELQEIISDENYTALSKVNVEAIPNEYIVPSGTIEIQINGEYNVKQYEKAKVEIGGIKKGIVINEFDDDGYAIDVGIAGIEDIPSYYLYHACFKGSWLSKMEKELKLPDNLKSIGSHAFYQCSNLIMSKLPDNLKSIGTYAFANCSNITISELPIGITILENYVFQSCSKITKITCKGNLTKIGSYAFAYDTNFEKLVLPNVTSVPVLNSVNAFTTTKISGGSGYIYVPDGLVDSFKSASNWSTYASRIKGVSEL